MASFAATRVGVKFDPPTLGVEVSKTAAGGNGEKEQFMIDLKEFLAAGVSAEDMLQALASKKPNVINSQVVSMPQILRLLGEVIKNNKSSVAAVAAAATPSQESAPAEDKETSSAPLSSEKPKETDVPSAVSGNPSGIKFEKGMKIMAKLKNWSRPCKSFSYVFFLSCTQRKID